MPWISKSRRLTTSSCYPTTALFFSPLVVAVDGRADLDELHRHHRRRRPADRGCNLLKAAPVFGSGQPEQSGGERMQLVADKAEVIEDPPRLLDSGQTEAAAERPGNPDGDLVRSLQRQMYRTDI